MGPCYRLVVQAYLQLGGIVETCQCWFLPQPIYIAINTAGPE